MEAYVVKTTDPIVIKTIQMLDQRSCVGLAKYGTTLDENNKDNFYQHAIEEALDLANYLVKLKSNGEKAIHHKR